MPTDALRRRLRFAPPAPKVRRLLLQEADHLIFEAIDRHGPLPTPYLYGYTRHLRRDYTYLQHRLTELYNGDAGGPYLIRPPRQFEGFEARYQHMAYGLGRRAKIALAERGTLTRFAPRRSDPFLHQLMSACVAASMELSAGRCGVRYIPREKILCHPKCPQHTRLADNPLAIGLPGAGSGALVPDDLFGIEYPGVGFRFFAVEIDRNTESLDRKRAGHSTIARKVEGYSLILRHQTHVTRWGVPNLSVLIVTTNAVHAGNILECVRRGADSSLQDRFAVACEPTFGMNWRMPKAPLRLLDQPWSTPSGTRRIDRP